MQFIEQRVQYLQSKEMLSLEEVNWLQEQRIIYQDDQLDETENPEDETDRDGNCDKAEFYGIQESLEARSKPTLSTSTHRLRRSRKRKDEAKSEVNSRKTLAEARTISSLVRALSDSNFEVRVAAATILANTELSYPGKAIPGLTVALDDPVVSVTHTVAAALLSIAPDNVEIRKKSQMTLLMGLVSEIADTRRSAIEALRLLPLGFCGFALPFLARSLRDQESENWVVANPLINAWRREIADDRALVILESYCIANQRLEMQSDESFVSQIQNSMLRGLRKDLHHENVPLRLATARLLLALDPSLLADVLPALAEAVRSTDVSARMAAIRVLGMVKGEPTEQILAPIVACLSDSDSTIRGEAVRAFTSIYSRAIDAAARSAELHNHRVDAVRIETAKAWGLIGGDNAVKVLVEMLSDRSSEVRLVAARSLAHLGPEAIDAYPVLMQSIGHDSDLTVRKAAIEAALEIGRYKKQFLRALSNCERTADAELRNFVSEARRLIKNR